MTTSMISSASHLTTQDGTQLYFKDWGAGQPVVFSHGWPLNADMWDGQMFFLASHGYRCIAHDRRGHGRSTQPWLGNEMDTYADDLATLMNTLDLRDAVMIAHSTGGGELSRYLGRHGFGRVSKVILVSAIPPLLLKTDKNPDGIPVEVFDQLRQAHLADRGQFYRDFFAGPFCGFNRPGAQMSEGLVESLWFQSMQAGLTNVYDCIKALSETDFTEDLKKFTAPTLIIHGDDDQVVPIGISAMRSSSLIRGATLKVYEGAPHALPATHADRLNADILQFIQS